MQKLCFKYCRTLAQDYDISESYLDTNQISPSNAYSEKQDSSSSLQPRMQYLTKKQRKLAEKNPQSIYAVVDGALLAIRECQHQFEKRLWNCPTQPSNVGGSIFGRILNIGKNCWPFFCSFFALQLFAKDMFFWIVFQAVETLRCNVTLKVWQ